MHESYTTDQMLKLVHFTRSIRQLYILAENWLEKYSLNEVGTWEVRGEDPNCDLGGFHHYPFIGCFEGTLQSVIELAVCLPGFWQWGYGGTIKKVIVTSVTERAEIEREIGELRARLAELEELVK